MIGDLRQQEMSRTCKLHVDGSGGSGSGRLLVEAASLQLKGHIDKSGWKYEGTT
jgi:hypothetical protein